jgi:hypothetical protein
MTLIPSPLHPTGPSAIREPPNSIMSVHGRRGNRVPKSDGERNLQRKLNDKMKKDEAEDAAAFKGSAQARI